MAIAVAIKDLSRNYREVKALSEINLSLESGEVLGLLGPNGAGKTTLIRILQGVLQPSQGSVEIWGSNPSASSVRTKCGNTPQDDAIPEGLTVNEALSYVARHYPAPRSLGSILEQFRIQDIAKQRMSKLSGGQRRRVSVAMAFIGSPSLVLLDEPTAGLDVQARREIIETIRYELSRGVTAIITSHYLDDIEALAGTVAVLQAGHLRTSGPLDKFVGKTDDTVITIHSVFPSQVANFFSERDRYDIQDNLIRVKTTQPELILHNLHTSLVEFEIRSLERGNLEDAFVGLLRTDRSSSDS